MTYGCVCVWLLCLLNNWNVAYVIQFHLIINAIWFLGILKWALSAAIARNTLRRKCVKSNVLPALPTASVLAIDKIYVDKKFVFFIFSINCYFIINVFNKFYCLFYTKKLLSLQFILTYSYIMRMCVVYSVPNCWEVDNNPLVKKFSK